MGQMFSNFFTYIQLYAVIWFIMTQNKDRKWINKGTKNVNQKSKSELLLYKWMSRSVLFCLF